MTFLLFILILGLIVFVHEFGHFIMAKKNGIYVYEFSLGFGPKYFVGNTSIAFLLYSSNT